MQTIYSSRFYVDKKFWINSSKTEKIALLLNTDRATSTECVDNFKYRCSLFTGFLLCAHYFVPSRVPILVCLTAVYRLIKKWLFLHLPIRRDTVPETIFSFRRVIFLKIQLIAFERSYGFEMIKLNPVTAYATIDRPFHFLTL